MDLIAAALPFVAFLACPLMMVVCVIGMRRMSHGAPSHDEAPAPSGSREEQVARLRHQVAAIQAELAALEAPEPDPSRDEVPQGAAGQSVAAG